MITVRGRLVDFYSYSITPEKVFVDEFHRQTLFNVRILYRRGAVLAWVGIVMADGEKVIFAALHCSGFHSVYNCSPFD